MSAKKMTFEQQLGRLEEIVAALEAGDVSLADSLKLFEEGTKLTAYCNKLLKEAEQKIVKLTDLEQGDAVEMNDRQGEDMGEELSD